MIVNWSVRCPCSDSDMSWCLINCIIIIIIINIVGVGRIFETVCLSVCPQHNSKTNDPKVFKLGVVGNDFRIS